MKRVEDFFFIDGNDEQDHPFLSPNINTATVGFSVAQAPKAWYQAASQKLDGMQAVELGNRAGRRRARSVAAARRRGVRAAHLGQCRCRSC